jgi:hypothetical protein
MKICQLSTRVTASYRGRTRDHEIVSIFKDNGRRSDHRRGVVCIGQTGLEGNATVGRVGKTWSVVIPTIEGPSLGGISIGRTFFLANGIEYVSVMETR